MDYGDSGSNFRNNFIFIVVILLISIATSKVLMQIHNDHFNLLWRAAYSVLEGKPNWIAYQNRLLGPSIVYLISKIGVSYSFALIIYIFLMTALQNLLLYFLLRKMNISCHNALIWVSLYSFAFLLVQYHWFYPWDSIDAIIFTLFAYGIFQGKSLRYFLLLFCVELLNRETALFIALYIIIDSFHFGPVNNRFYLASKKKLIIGIFLILFGAIYTKAIRDYLFISRHNGLPDTAHELIGNHIYLISNLKNLFFYNLFSLKVINTSFILGTIVFLIYYVKLYTDAQIKLLLVYCAIVANILVFGLINETRMYIILIPFLIFFIVFVDRNLTIATTRTK